MDDEDRADQNKLDDAIREYHKDTDGLLSGYVLVSAHTTFDGAEEATRYATAYLGGSMPFHSIMGLLHYATNRMNYDAVNWAKED